MIKKLGASPIYTTEGVLTGHATPDGRDICEKINEIIDHINAIEEGVKSFFDSKEEE